SIRPSTGSGRACRLNRLLPREEPVDPAREIFQVRCVAGGDFGREEATIPGVVEGAPDLEPIDVAVAEVGPGEAAVRPIEVKVLEVDLRDAGAERANPVLRIAVEHDVAHVEIGFQPRRI